MWEVFSGWGDSRVSVHDRKEDRGPVRNVTKGGAEQKKWTSKKGKEGSIFKGKNKNGQTVH